MFLWTASTEGSRGLAMTSSAGCAKRWGNFCFDGTKCPFGPIFAVPLFIKFGWWWFHIEATLIFIHRTEFLPACFNRLAFVSPKRRRFLTFQWLAFRSSLHPYQSVISECSTAQMRVMDGTCHPVGSHLISIRFNLKWFFPDFLNMPKIAVHVDLVNFTFGSIWLTSWYFDLKNFCHEDVRAT